MFGFVDGEYYVVRFKDGNYYKGMGIYTGNPLTKNIKEATLFKYEWSLLNDNLFKTYIYGSEEKEYELIKVKVETKIEIIE